DSNYNPSDGACEPLTVNKADSSLTTDIHNAANDAIVTSLALGGSVYDSGTVSTGSSFATKPTGTVTFTWFTNGSCTPTGTSAGSDRKSAVYGKGSPPGSQGPLAAGAYSFIAHYGGGAD